MIYGSGAAFRMALEERLRREAVVTGIPLARLRKTVAFDRMLARLAEIRQDTWVLKGGFALQIRFSDRARTTTDIDLHTGETVVRAIELLMAAAELDLGDFFSFTVPVPSRIREGALRFGVEARLDGRMFEGFHVDLGVGEPMLGEPARATVTALLAFAGIQPVDFLCYPLAQHLAEKVHALTRPRGINENSRVKDLIDHALPRELPPPPRAWAPQYRRMARDTGLISDTLEVGGRMAAALVDPVLGGLDSGRWSPETSTWREHSASHRPSLS